jgi:hypothetical protein
LQSTHGYRHRLSLRGHALGMHQPTLQQTWVQNELDDAGPGPGVRALPRWTGRRHFLAVHELGSTGPVHAATHTHRGSRGRWRPGSESRARTHTWVARAPGPPPATPAAAMLSARVLASFFFFLILASSPLVRTSVRARARARADVRRCGLAAAWLSGCTRRPRPGAGFGRLDRDSGVRFHGQTGFALHGSEGQAPM